MHAISNSEGECWETKDLKFVLTTGSKTQIYIIIQGQKNVEKYAIDLRQTH